MLLSWVACGYALALALLFLGCRLVARTMGGLPGLRATQWAIAMALLSSLVRAGRFHGFPLPLVIGNNYLFLGYLLLVYQATVQLLRKRSPLFWVIVAAWIAGLPLFWYFTSVHPDAAVRIVVGSSLKAIAAGATALLCFGRSPLLLVKRARLLGGLHLAFAALNAGRVAATLADPPGNWRYVDWLQTGFSYGQLICCFAACCGIVWLATHERDEELKRLGATDSLSGLPNRRAFEAALEGEMLRGSGRVSSVALVLVDLDHFKRINDTFGHPAGDEVIRRVSDVLRHGVRAADMPARYGGEEFAILLRDVSAKRAETMAERLRSQIEEIVFAQGDLRVTASVGLAMGRHTESPGDFFDRCDAALYGSKRMGRNRVTVSQWAAGDGCEPMLTSASRG